jgi:class 3 adenylate cyclase
MMDAVHRCESTISRMQDDGILALFGAPIAHEDHALRACYAAACRSGASAEQNDRECRLARLLAKHPRTSG